MPPEEPTAQPGEPQDDKREVEELKAALRLATRAADNNKLTLTVAVSERSDGLKMYGFAYEGAPVLMGNNEGFFDAIPGETGLLEWAMLGDPGSTMKVEVRRDKTIIAKRNKSMIDPPSARGFDALLIRDLEP